MTKLSKTKILAKRKVQSAERKAKNTARELSHAQMEAQIAELEAKIALLEGSGQNTAHCPQHAADHSPRATGNSPRARAGIPLLPPIIESVRQLDSRSLQVSWAAVEDAAGYVIRVSSDSTLATDVRTVEVAAPVTTATLGGLRAETTYFIKAKAVAGAGGTDSDFSGATSATTGFAADDDTATNLQHWLADQQSLQQYFIALLPQADGEVLSPVARKRLLGSGVRRYGYIDKVSDVAKDYPQFWPMPVQSSGGIGNYQDKLKERLREIEAWRNLLIAFRFGVRIAEDRLLTAGDDAFRMANLYYRSVREAARGHLPEAADVFQMLQLFWNKPRGMTGEPEEEM